MTLRWLGSTEHSRPVSDTRRNKITYRRDTHSIVLNGEERGKMWAKARGMGKHRKPEPIRDHQKVRKELDRQVPD